MATGAPPLPPEIAAQADPAQAQSVFAQQGVDQAGQAPQPGQRPGMDMIQAALAKWQELEKWLGEQMMLLKQINPNLQAHLKPIAQAGQEGVKALQEMAQRSGMQRGSPVVPPQPPQNPSAGPPNPNTM